MPKYKVTIYLNAIDYEIEAENPEVAIQNARDYAIQESQYDLLKWADYETEELE